MAFQIIDDILDVVATDEQLGKPAGHDLVEGVYTLPILRALLGPAGPTGRAPRPAPRARGGGRGPRHHPRRRVRRRRARVARAYVDEGRAALDDLGSSPVVDAMAEASDVLVAQIDDFGD